MKARKAPPPAGLPFALVETGAKGLRLVAVNAAARRFGLTRGQRLADARAAVPDLLSELHEPEADMASLLGLCRWLERYSPWVSPDAPDGVLLDVTGIPHLFGGEAAMLAEMGARLGRYGFTARIEHRRNHRRRLGPGAVFPPFVIPAKAGIHGETGRNVPTIFARRNGSRLSPG